MLIKTIYLFHWNVYYISVACSEDPIYGVLSYFRGNLNLLGTNFVWCFQISKDFYSSASYTTALFKLKSFMAEIWSCYASHQFFAFAKWKILLDKKTAMYKKCFQINKSQYMNSPQWWFCINFFYFVWKIKKHNLIKNTATVLWTFLQYLEKLNVICRRVNIP